MHNITFLRRLFSVALFMAMPFFASAYAEPAQDTSISNLSMLVDPQGVETIATVSQAARAHDFIPTPHGFSAGYTRKVHWLRFTLTPPAPASDGSRRLLLEFYPPFLDDLQVFIPRADGTGFERFIHGDLQAFSSRAIHHRAFVQSVDFQNELAMVVYLRLQTTSSSVVVIDALTPDQYVDDTSQEYALLGIFFGLLVAGLLANLRYAFRGDALQRAFLFHLTTTLFMLFAINGLLAQYVFQNSAFWSDHCTSLGSTLVVASATFFYGKVLEMERAALWMRSIYRIVFWLGILFLPSSFLGFYPETQRILIMGALVVVLTGMLRSMQLYRQQAWGSLLIVLALLCSLLGASAATLTLLGVLPGQSWLVNSYTISTLGTLAALQAYFMLHARLIETRLLNARMEATRAAAVLETERASQEAQRRFLAMLTHELKTPLSALRLCIAQIAQPGRLRHHAENAIEQIDSVIERCDLASRFDDGRLEVSKITCSLHELLAELVTERNGSNRNSDKRILIELPHTHSIVLQTDPILLRTVLDNLLSNAWKYSPPQASILIAASLQSQQERAGVLLRVSNPVASALMRPDPQQVFTKYYRAPEAQHSTGSGLGLYLVRGLSLMLGGDARYLPDQPDVTFEIWIPR